MGLPRSCNALRALVWRRHYHSAGNLVQIRSGTFYREHPASVSSPVLNPPLFPDLTFTIAATSQTDVDKSVRHEGHWAVIGAGDVTNFLRVLRGELLSIPPSARTFPYLASEEIGAKDARLRIPSHAVQYVGFNTGNAPGLGGVGGTQGAYLSARYESRREETDWSVMQYLKGETELNPSEQLSHVVTNTGLLNRVVRDLRLEKLLDMPVSNLSNGQSRRCRIAKALLGEPECLLLDEPFMGLDPPTLVALSPILKDLALRSNPLLVLGLRPQDPVPEWITDLVVLGKDHKVGLMGPKDEIMDELSRWKEVFDEGPTTSNAQSETGRFRHLYDTFGKPFEGFGDTLTERGIEACDTQSSDAKHVARPTLPKEPDTLSSSISYLEPAPKPLIELESIVLSYGNKVVLGHKTASNPNGGLSLTINQGSRLALLGSNGSGKTTLLSLLTSDHPQSYSLPIKFFGRTRLPTKGIPGLSLWEIQSRIGHGAPEVHSFYPKGHSIRRVLESAWAETYSTKPRLDNGASLLVDRFIAYWTPELRQTKRHSSDSEVASSTTDLSWASDRETHYFRILPFGTQRLLLLLRAIIRSPDIIILDEAFSGLDSAAREKVMAFLETGEDSLKEDDPLGEIMAKMPGQPFKGLTSTQALIVVSHVREEVPRCVIEWVRLPSEEEVMESGQDVLVGNAHTLANGKGLRSKEGWREVWGV